MSGFKHAAVSVVPNASRVRGQLLHIGPDRGGRGSLWEVKVKEARDVPGMPNFAVAHVGKAINIYVHPELKSPLKAGDTLEARVAYRGDERGGEFAIVDDDVRRL
jgi:hypothetical protein